MVHGCILGNEAVIPPVTRLFNAVRSREEAKMSRPRLPLAGARPWPHSSPHFGTHVPPSVATIG
jgi:hypothetical protein